jgi:hypothetical protein
MFGITIIETQGFDIAGNEMPEGGIYATYGNKRVVLIQANQGNAYTFQRVLEETVHNPYDLRILLQQLFSPKAIDSVMEQLSSAFSESTCSCCGGGKGDGFPFYASRCVGSESCDN